MIKLLIADDHAIVREGIHRILAVTQDIRITSEAIDGPDVLQKLKTGTGYNLLLLNLTMPSVNRTDLIGQIKIAYPNLPMLVFSIHNEPHVASLAIRAGASGFIFKDCNPADLIEAIRRVAGGGKYIATVLAKQLAFDALFPEQRAPHLMLSKREFEVFGLLVTGKRSHEIADQLNISSKTVSTHKLNLLVKMKLSCIADLIHYAAERDLSLF